MQIVSKLRRTLRPLKRSYQGIAQLIDKNVVSALLRPFNFSTTAVVDSHKYKIPIQRGIGRDLRSASEPWMSDLLRRLFSLGAAPGLVDVGVNVGQTLLKLKSIDPKLRYLGFEPNPFCISLVQELVKLNGFVDCELAPAALSDRAGLISFVASSESDSGASMITTLRPDKKVHRKQWIAALVFDNLDVDVSSMGVVKIDVEGAELFVLQGMKQFIERVRPYIVCEVLHAHSALQLNDSAARNEQIFELASQTNYTVCRIRKGADRVAALEHIRKFPDLVWDQNSPAVCDYLLIPFR